MSTQSFFSQLGANTKETNAYLELLKFGAQPVSVIAKHLGIKRTSMYVMIEKLIKLGLIEQFNNHGATFVKAINAEKLRDLLTTREKRITQAKQDLEKMMPELEQLENRLSITPSVRFYEGRKAVMNMYEEVTKETEICAFFNPELVQKNMPEYTEAVANIVKTRKGYAREILVFSSEARKYQQHFQSGKHEIKILPKGVSFGADVLMGKDKIFMVAYGDNQIVGTEIHNTSLAHAHRVMFEQLWERLK